MAINEPDPKDDDDLEDHLDWSGVDTRMPNG